MAWFGLGGVFASGRGEARADGGAAREAKGFSGAIAVLGGADGEGLATPGGDRGMTAGLSGAGAGTGGAVGPAAVRAAYLGNPVAQRSIRLVAEAVGSAPLRASDDALAALVARTAAGQRLTETVAAQLMIHGIAYVQLLKDEAGALRDLFALRPDRVSVVADAGGWPAAYRYRVGRRERMLAAAPPAGTGGDDKGAEVIAIRAYHPLDDHGGASALGAALGAVATHNAAGAWNRALLANAARPSGALTMAQGERAMPLSDGQFARLKAEMADAFEGAMNAGRPLLLEGDLKWQSLSLSLADMDFAGMKAMAAREIAMALGVPPMLIGLPGDATYANYREASKALWRLTVLPLAGRILEALAQGVRPWFPDAALAVDLDRVPALGADREALWAQVGAADFLTVEEKRAMVGV